MVAKFGVQYTPYNNNYHIGHIAKLSCGILDHGVLSKITNAIRKQLYLDVTETIERILFAWLLLEAGVALPLVELLEIVSLD